MIIDSHITSTLEQTEFLAGSIPHIIVAFASSISKQWVVTMYRRDGGNWRLMDRAVAVDRSAVRMIIDDLRSMVGAS